MFAPIRRERADNEPVLTTRLCLGFLQVLRFQHRAFFQKLGDTYGATDAASVDATVGAADANVDGSDAAATDVVDEDAADDAASDEDDD